MAGQRHTIRLLVLAGCLLVIAAAIGFFVGHRSAASAPPAALDRQASTGELTLSYPADWRPRDFQPLRCRV
jgi:hypothetical protein